MIMLELAHGLGNPVRRSATSENPRRAPFASGEASIPRDRKAGQYLPDVRTDRRVDAKDLHGPTRAAGTLLRLLVIALPVASLSLHRADTAVIRFTSERRAILGFQHGKPRRMRPLRAATY